MAYAIENALFQWEEGSRRAREHPGAEPAVAAVLDELRRRLGSAFTLAELAALYGEGADWALEVAERAGAHGDAAWVADAAFHRYAHQAADYGGGRRRAEP